MISANSIENKKTVPALREKMPLWYSLVWSSRGASQILNVLLVSYVVYFSTDMLGLNPAVVGAIILGTKIFDAITDIMFGYILDKTRTKLGKARPYELFLLAEWALTVMIFAIPNLSRTGQYIWIGVLYTLVNAVCCTALGGADSVYMSRAFPLEKNRVTALSVNGVCVYVVSIVFSMMFPMFLANAGTECGAGCRLRFALLFRAL